MARGAKAPMRGEAGLVGFGQSIARGVRGANGPLQHRAAGLYGNANDGGLSAERKKRWRGTCLGTLPTHRKMPARSLLSRPVDHVSGKSSRWTRGLIDGLETF